MRQLLWIGIALAVVAFAFVPSAEAVGWCVKAGPVHATNTGSSYCPSVVCTGYHYSRGWYEYWDNCYPPPIYP